MGKKEKEGEREEELPIFTPDMVGEAHLSCLNIKLRALRGFMGVYWGQGGGWRGECY